MERSFGRFNANATSSGGLSASERLGQGSGKSSLSRFFQSKPARAVHYTISEDRCGTSEDVMNEILARVGDRRGHAEQHRNEDHGVYEALSEATSPQSCQTVTGVNLPHRLRLT